MNVLNRICIDKRAHIETQKTRKPLAEIKAELKDIPVTRGFIKNISDQNPALIAEVKKASPSGGIIRTPFDPAEIALAYERAGAACLSVLTDAPYFQGRDEDLRTVRQNCQLPLLRKDFMIDPYQIYESRLLGADCILLIMAALEDTLAAEIYDCALDIGLDVLIETHDREEIERALSLARDPERTLIGVNNRNLKTLKVDLQTARDLAISIPKPFMAVAESGIKTHAHLKDLQRHGYRAFLVGESLMRQTDVEQATHTLLNG